MFQMFGLQHYAALAAAVLACVVIVVWRKRLREPAVGRRFRLALAVLLIACEVSLQISYYWDGGWGAGTLPLQLCSLMVLISAAMLMFQVRRMYSIVFFLGILGALQAMVTPNLDQPFPHFRYFHFFIAHIGIIAAALYLLAVERYMPTLKSVFAAWAWLHVLAIPAAVVNIATGTTNFMFLAHKPETASLLDALAPWPWYLLQLELIAVAMCLLLLAAVYAVHWIKKRATG